MSTISLNYYMYINFIVEFIIMIVGNINLYNIFRYIGSKLWSDWHKKMCQFRWPFFSICTRIINLHNATDEFAIIIYLTWTLKCIFYCMKVGGSDVLTKNIKRSYFAKETHSYGKAYYKV